MKTAAEIYEILSPFADGVSDSVDVIDLREHIKGLFSWIEIQGDEIKLLEMKRDGLKGAIQEAGGVLEYCEELFRRIHSSLGGRVWVEDDLGIMIGRFTTKDAEHLVKKEIGKLKDVA